MTEPLIEQLTYLGSLAVSAGIGLSMSGHCFGMCGAMASVIGMTGTGKPLGRITAYNAGRVTTYCLMGVIAGAISQRVHVSFGQSWLPAAVAIFSCAIMVLAGLALMGLVPDRCLGAVFPSGLLGRMIVRPTPLLPGPAKVFAIGLLLGFLPCMATFGMLLFALNSGTWHRGGLIMAAFGAGTLPVMMGVPYVAGAARRFGRTSYGRLAGVLLLALAAASMWELWSMSANGGCQCH